MSQTTKRIEISGSKELYCDMRNSMFPCLKASFVIAHRYIVNTDFASGNGIDIEVDGATNILFAVAKTPSNTFLTLTESALTAPRQGIKIATGTATTDVEVYIIAEV